MTTASSPTLYAPPVRTPLRTVGVEEELLLVDAETMQLVPLAGSALEHAAESEESGATLEFEVKQEQIEVVSPPLASFDEILRAIVDGRVAADAAAQSVGARAVALATAGRAGETHLAPVPRYERMQDRFGLTLHEQLTCGLHVHVSVASDEEGVAVLDRIRPWLPVLLALSANSPYWRGWDTGFASYRYQAWTRWPSAGPYDLAGSAAEYFARVDESLAADIALDVGMIYSDARLSHHAPTVEIRIADVCLRPSDSAALAVLARAVVETAAAEWRAGMPADAVPASFLRLASWRASKSGLNDRLVDPLTRRPVAASSAVQALLLHVRDRFASDEELRFVLDAVATILREGTGESRQRAAMGIRGELTDVVAEAVRLTAQL